MSSNSLDDWWGWRRDKDRREREMEAELAKHSTDIAVLQTRQKIAEDNAEVRHSKGPQLIYWLFSGALGLIALILQLLAAGRIP